jgi:signal transduction histidine kinase/CheY-like chemotaxis protein
LTFHKGPDNFRKIVAKIYGKSGKENGIAVKRLRSVFNRLQQLGRTLRVHLNIDHFETDLENDFRLAQQKVSSYFVGIFSGCAFLAYSIFNFRRALGISDLTHTAASKALAYGLGFCFAYAAFVLLFSQKDDKFRNRITVGMCYFAGLSIPILNLFRPNIRADGDTIAFITTILALASISKFIHRQAIVWLMSVILAFLLSKKFSSLLNSGNSNTLQILGDPAFDPVKLNIHVAVTMLFAYFIFRLNESRDRQLFIREHRIAQSAAERLHLLQAIGHDLRQPMTAINLHCDLARNAFATKNTEAFIRSIDVVQQNVSAVNLELTQLTELAAAAENSENKAAPVAVGVILQRLYVSNLPRADLAGIDLHINLPKESALSYALSDEAVLSRVFGNILNNAIKFTELKKATELRSVSIDLLTDENCVKVLISDTGIGIAEEHLNSIWAPFFQVNNPERNREHGFGLGLAHVQASLNQLTGHAVLLRSTLGIGTTFEISMPRANALDIPLLPAPSLASDVSVQALQGSLILVVEDDSVLREALADGLQLAGARVVTAATIAIANVVLASLEVEPDLVMVDYRLPDGNGRDFLETVIEKLGARASGGPALACLSGEHISALKLDGLPGLKLIRKPIDLPSLVEKLRHHLEL